MQNDGMHGETRRGRELIGLPVYTISEGKRLGQINGLIVRRADCSIPIVSIETTGLGTETYLPYTALVTVGVDIALVDTEAALRKEMALGESDGLDTDLPGRPVITQSGEKIGKIAGFGVDTSTGHIVFFRVEANASFWGKVTAMGKDNTVEVPTAMVISLGPDAVIVQDAVKELLSPPA